MSDCVFCKIVSGAIPSQKIFDDDAVCAFLDAFPISRGHTLLIPKIHFDRFDLVPQAIIVRLASKLHYLAPRIAAVMQADGFNLGMNNGPAAGQVVQHVHWHIIPRYNNDGLRHWPNRTVGAAELDQIGNEIRSRIQ